MFEKYLEKEIKNKKEQRRFDEELKALQGTGIIEKLAAVREMAAGRKKLATGGLSQSYFAYLMGFSFVNPVEEKIPFLPVKDENIKIMVDKMPAGGIPGVSFVEMPELSLMHECRPAEENSVFVYAVSKHSRFGLSCEGLDEASANRIRVWTLGKLAKCFKEDIEGDAYNKAYILYSQAFRKYHDKAKYIAAYINVFPENLSLAIARNRDIRISLPCINLSKKECTVRDSEIILGFCMIKGFELTEKILEYRAKHGPFKSCEEFYSNISVKNAQEKIIKCTRMLRNLWDYDNRMPYDLLGEKNVFGAIVSIECLEKMIGSQKRNGYSGIVTEITKRKTKEGKHMALLKMETVEGEMKAVLFPQVYEEVKERLEPESCIFIRGSVKREDKELIAQEIAFISHKMFMVNREDYDAETAAQYKVKSGGGRLYILEKDGTITEENGLYTVNIISLCDIREFPQIC